MEHLRNEILEVMIKKMNKLEKAIRKIESSKPNDLVKGLSRKSKSDLSEENYLRALDYITANVPEKEWKGSLYSILGSSCNLVTLLNRNNVPIPDFLEKEEYLPMTEDMEGAEGVCGER